MALPRPSMQSEALNADSRDLLVALVKHEVEFLIVGAWALAAHGYPRATVDFDVLVRPSHTNAARVVAALREFGAPLAAHGVEEDDFTRPGNIYQIGQPPRRIDILTAISGVTFQEAWTTRHLQQLGGLSVAFLGLEALIRNKRAAGRPKDLADVARLVARPPNPE